MTNLIFGNRQLASKEAETSVFETGLRVAGLRVWRQRGQRFSSFQSDRRGTKTSNLQVRFAFGEEASMRRQKKVRRENNYVRQVWYNV